MNYDPIIDAILLGVVTVDYLRTKLLAHLNVPPRPILIEDFIL
jgi:hypothetical protein